MKETDLQFHIKKSIIRDGGYCKKLTNRFTIGIPDLIIALPPFVPCLAEVKELGECVEGFNRKLDVSPKQGHELQTFNNIYGPENRTMGRVSLLLVGLMWQGERRLVALPPEADRLTAALLTSGVHYGRTREVGNYYNIGNLLNSVNIAKAY